MNREFGSKIFKKPSVLLVLTLVLATLASAYRGLGFSQTGYIDPLLGAVSAGLLFIGVPLLIIRYLYKERVSEYGWRLPVWTTNNCLIVAGVLAAHIIGAIALAQLPDFKEFYVLPEESRLLLFSCGLVLTAVYFTAEEFLFRGFLLWSFWKKYRYVGVGITILLFGFLHFGKVPLEIVVAVVSGTSLAWVGLKTKSFIPAVFIHWAFALTVNVLVNFIHV